MIQRLIERRRFMREHRWTHAHLSDYLDQDLDPKDSERIAAHASICPQCRRVLATLGRTLLGLSHMRTAGPPGLADRVIERLHDEEE